MIFEPEEIAPVPSRCAILVDATLPIGRVANAVAVIAVSLGNRHPLLAGPDLIDASGHAHPGLIPIGVTVLAAGAADLSEVRAKALKRGIDTVDFAVQGQQTTDYAEFGARVREVPTESLIYVGVGLYGSRKEVSRIVGRFPLLK